MRQDVRRQAERMGLAGDALDDFVVAFNELIINAVRHGGGSGTVSLRTDGDILICEVADDGPGFAGGPPSVAAPPPPDAPGGRGLWLAHHLTDGLSIRTGSTGVTTRVTVTLDGGRPSPG